MTTINITGYWTFICNPAKWEVDRFLESDPADLTYMVTSWQAEHFAPGQMGLLRVGVDRRTRKLLGTRTRLEPGIFAVVETLGPALSSGQGPDEYWLDWTEAQGKRPFVELRVVRNMLDDPLLLANLSGEAAADDYLVNGFQAATMPLIKGAFEAVSHELKLRRRRERADTLDQVAALEQRMLNEKPRERQRLSKVVERGPVGAIVKRLARWECPICAELGLPAQGFAKASGGFYAEAHHVIPVATGEVGTLGFANVICVCATHHRQLHYGKAAVVENNKRDFVFEIDGQRLRVAKSVVTSA